MLNVFLNRWGWNSRYGWKDWAQRVYGIWKHLHLWCLVSVTSASTSTIANSLPYPKLQDSSDLTTKVGSFFGPTKLVLQVVTSMRGKRNELSWNSWAAIRLVPLEIWKINLISCFPNDLWDFIIISFLIIK